MPGAQAIFRKALHEFQECEMKNRLPPLDLLRGFEVAARHLSFTRAADELSLTQSAVSRQIKALEDHLGAALFKRRHRALLLTDAGQLLLRAVSDALRRIAEATEQLRAPSRTLTVSTTISFASLWLVPRLASFRRAHPEADIRIDANNRLVDLERDGIEVAIRYAPPSLVPADAIRLFGEEVMPVASPALLRRQPLTTAADLANHVLLHYERPDGGAPWLSWPAWFEVVGAAPIQPRGALHLTQYDQVIQAAVDGQGVAIATTPLVKHLIREGKLVAPLKQRAASARAYYAVVTAQAARQPEVAAFVQWLIAQANEDEARDTTATRPSARAKRAPRRSSALPASSPRKRGSRSEAVSSPRKRGSSVV
jgi:DNA-binding transcriptional LysR family regulator